MKKNIFIGLFSIFIVFAVISEIAFAAEAKIKKTYTEREYTTEIKDGQLIRAYLSYPKTKQKGYPTVILLHSLGKTSNDWKPLQEEFSNSGFAVLRLDFRGHGKSVYDNTYRQKSWTRYKKDAFEKYPDDVLSVIEKIQKETKKADFNNYVIIGSDIGANTAVLVAKKMKVKPKALVLISPAMTFKGLYIPIAMTEIGKTPILAMTSKTHKYFMEEQEKLSKFAQGNFDIYNTESGGADMMIIRQFPNTQKLIFNWTIQQFKN